MTATIIDGSLMAQEIRDEVRLDVARLKERGVEPGLAVILVGDNPASVSYVRGKARDAVDVGIRAETIRLPSETTEDALLGLVRELNGDPRWHAILVQLPLPAQINEALATGTVAVEKDVDGLHPVNTGRLLRGEPSFWPCTPHGVKQMLVRSGNDPGGKHVVICGRSNLVGKPLAGLLMQKSPGANATVTVCHTATPDLRRFTLDADILIAVMGQPGAITADMVREGAVVIDVGVNRIPDPSKKSGGRLVGDVDFESVARKAAQITPVPGGVGPMTRAMLLYNTVLAASGGPGVSAIHQA